MFIARKAFEFLMAYAVSSPVILVEFLSCLLLLMNENYHL